jgi:hypothetical protein
MGNSTCISQCDMKGKIKRLVIDDEKNWLNEVVPNVNQVWACVIGPSVKVLGCERINKVTNMMKKHWLIEKTSFVNFN